ncbi:NAD(P)/FAD-dependent oxidoreductase [Leptolyngbyaceae cyanobacterium CCMR0082]|uniref:NAD(P)/FAD-dependent oxidoreductase n=3 Tax=Adonisia TaxID=2950183 RepID=A0A6M0SEB2_9CYAN|nr:NAD(P)/FAD-dependent oxidoreductase [Leptothoe sp. LEGE 181152]NEZ55893.1 NAD(P)/FAD-dependent oxidoreductase [Adonisia turfae CCMR0081]NEZ66002.1 NAD(P)/FAD-dependent oxidoreductase [Adonisia turfae CCMR0082]
MMFDCIVVGAGPGGSTTAYQLAKRGRSVLLLEKHTLPRYKPCTGAVAPSIATWLDFDITPAIDQKLRRIRYTWQLDDPIEAELETDEPMWIVRRDIFDQYLIDQALKVGVVVKDGTPVTSISFKDQTWTVNTDHGSYEGQYLIAADGADGPMAKWLGFKSEKVRQGYVLEIDLPTPEPHPTMAFEFGLVKQGCLWNFPKHQGHSLGITRFLGDNLKDPEQSLATFARGLGDDAEAGQLYSHGLKLWNGNTPLHTKQALLVGEAAALVDPMTAEGIRPAIFSGIQAAKAINKALDGDNKALANYSQVIHEEWGNDIQWSHRIANIFFRMQKIGYRVGIKRPTATKRLGQLLAGEIRYADLANRVIKRISGSLLPGRGA